MTGRRPLITRDLIDGICQTVRSGNSLKTAALTSGIGDSTLHVWRNRGEAEEARLAQPGTKPRQKEALYRDFASGLREAQAEARRLHVDTVRLASVPHPVTTTTVKQVIGKDGEIVTLTETRTTTEFDWKASAWWLERAAREDYGRSVEVAGPGGGEIPMRVSVPQLDMSPKALEAWGEMLNRTFNNGVDPGGSGPVGSGDTTAEEAADGSGVLGPDRS